MSNQESLDERLTSEILASFIIDALFRAGFVRAEDLDEARSLTAEEINVRHLSGELQFL